VTITLEAAPEAELEELEPGELAYQEIGEVIRELQADTLLVLLSAMQGAQPWDALPPALRAVFGALEDRLFEIDDAAAE
jgi:hypothetical protein